MAVSEEELLIHDCQVVCPQCLAVCKYENGGLVVRDDSDAPFRHNATVDESKTEAAARFCHSCGKKLPEGISFCPYCGAQLNAPFETDVPTHTESEKPHNSQPVTRQETAQPVETQPQPRPQSEEPRQPTTQAGNKLRTIPRQYNSMHPQLHQHGSMPSTAFKIFAYTAIVLLLALLVIIIVAGINIEPSM